MHYYGLLGADVWKRPQKEGADARKRRATMSPATEQTLGTPTDTNATMQNPQNRTPMQVRSSAAESDAATEHIAAGAETIMSMQAIVTEFSAFSTDDARDLMNAAQVILKGDQGVIRNLCHPWGVQLKAKKISPHGNHQGGAHDGVDKACNEAEE